MHPIMKVFFAYFGLMGACIAALSGAFWFVLGAMLFTAWFFIDLCRLSDSIEAGE